MGRSGFASGGSGNRDFAPAVPIDQYRRNIGRQDSKKEKKFTKDVVRKGQEVKENTSRAVHDTVKLLVDYISEMREPVPSQF